MQSPSANTSHALPAAVLSSTAFVVEAQHAAKRKKRTTTAQEEGWLCQGEEGQNKQ
jgi:hypothetical protein